MAISIARTASYNQTTPTRQTHQACPQRRAVQQQQAASSSSAVPWTANVLPQLSTLLDAAGYSRTDAAACLTFTNDHLLRSDTLVQTDDIIDRQTWPSYLTDDHTPLEYSIDIGASGSAKVRYAFEPVPASSSRDPYNVQAPRAWLARARATMPDVDTAWHDQLSDALVIDPQAVHHHAIPKPDALSAQHLTQYLFALDFDKGAAQPMLKTYVLLDAPRRALGEEATMRRLDGCMVGMGLTQQWRALRTYLADVRQQRSDNGAQLEFVSVDCVERSRARCKPYVRFAHLTRADFQRHIRMGRDPSQLEPDEAAYARLCGAVWDALCDEHEAVSIDEDDDDAPRHQRIEQRTHGAIFYYEMRADGDDGTPRIQPKAYLPVRHLLADDGEIARRIDNVLARQSGGRLPSGWYTDLLQRFAAQQRSLRRGAGMQTMLGIALKNGQPSISVYLNPEAYSYRD